MGKRGCAAPGPGQVRLKQHAVGVNYIDTYQRSGLYKLPLPFVPGHEGAGEVVAVGPGVTDFKVGDRGAYAGAVGGYAEERVMPADRLVKLPDSIDYKTGAAMMLQGMTVRYLLRQTYKVVPARPCCCMRRPAASVSSPASGRGTSAPPSSARSARPTRRSSPRPHGCTHVINYKTEDFVKRTKELTNGQGVDVVYDAVGKDTYPGLARLPEAARPVGQLRQRLGRRSPTSICSPVRPRARSMPRGRRSAPTSPSARICSPTPTSCSTWCRRVLSRSTSTTPIR